MARPATGQIITHRTKTGQTTYTLRFRCQDGSRHTEPLGVVDRDEAEIKLRHRMADVERGWTPEPKKSTASSFSSEMPSFHEFAAEWWTLHEHEWAPKTEADYRSRLEQHLLGHFADDPLDRIDFAAVERYIAEKRREGLSPRSVNMTVTLMASILEVAVERELIPRNPTKGRGRRVRQRAPQRSYIDSAEGIAALLEAAGKQQTRWVRRRAILAVLCFTGLRVGELCALRWRHVDLASGWLSVGEAKTDAGVRRIKLRPIVREELATIRPVDADPNAFVFGTKRNKPPSQTNIGERVLRPAVEAANVQLVANGFAPLPEKLTPHSMRRTFASVLFGIGETPPTVMAELGHTDAAFTLSVYAQGMRRDEDEKAKLTALVEGVWANEWANESAEASDLASESRL